jgi:hypothetical protein
MEVLHEPESEPVIEFVTESMPTEVMQQPGRLVTMTY